MKNVITKSVKLALVSAIVSFLPLFINPISSSTFGFSAYFFIYLLTFFLIPYWLKNNNIKWSIKLILTAVVSIISILTIISTDGMGRTLNCYLIIFSILVIGSIISNLTKRK